MANYDVIITNSRTYHDPQIDNSTRLGLLIYAKAIYNIAVVDYTTTAGQRTLVANAVKAMAGLPVAEFPPLVGPIEVGMWFKSAESANLGLATASLTSKLAAIPYLLSLDDEILAKTNVYIMGVITTVLT